MNLHQAASFKPDFSAEKFSGGFVVSHEGLLAFTWMTRLYENPGGIDF